MRVPCPEFESDSPTLVDRHRQPTSTVTLPGVESNCFEGAERLERRCGIDGIQGSAHTPVDQTTWRVLGLTGKIGAVKDIATTRMSSRGQVVIPEAIRRRLGLETGVEFVVLGEGDTVVLKPISVPSMGEFDEIVARARRAARRAGLKRSDIGAAIEVVRSR